MIHPNNRPVLPLSLSRRRLLAGAGALALLGSRPANAVLKLDITQGNVHSPPLPPAEIQRWLTARCPTLR